MKQVPELRIRTLNDAAVAPSGDYVLYWMIANRRPVNNFSLDRAIEWARELDRPVVVLEALRCGYRWASDRLHYFVIQGMADNHRAFEDSPIYYYPYLEPEHGAGKGLLRDLANRACVVVSDDFPSFFLPKMVAAATDQVPVRFELVDSNGLLPMRATDKIFSRAFDFRRFLQKELLPHLAEPPARHPFARRKLPRRATPDAKILKRWPPAEVDRLADHPEDLRQFPIDHSVRPAAMVGGYVAAERALREFVEKNLRRYAEARNDPDEEATSRLSPYLHFGHLSAHHVFDEVTRVVGWTPDRVSKKATGSRSGWWGADENVEGYLDELVTWRELGFNMCSKSEDYDTYESLPDWARTTLEEHANDDREQLYTLEELEAAETYDDLWNATQRQLCREGRIHNYMRMLWGKKVLEWAKSPREALKILIELNNKYALDGRNPNSYSGIFWVFGRYDRAWGPERPIFGKIRYMSSDNTKRKLSVKKYLERFAAD